MVTEHATTVSDAQTESNAGSPPYLPYLTFKNFLTWLETDGIPLRFDRSAWEKKYSGSTGPQLMSGLRFLGLLDGEVPTEKLERLVDTRGDERKEVLIEVLKESYDTVDFNVLGRATPNMLRDSLAEYGIAGDTVRKAESFFVNAAKDLDMPLSSNLRKLARNRPPQNKSTTQSNSRRPSRKLQELPVETPTNSPPVTEQTYQADAQQSLMLWGLFKKLPPPGQEFPRSDREAWIKAAETLFDLEYGTDEYESESYE